MATPPDFSPGQVLTAAHMDAVGLWKVGTTTAGSAVTTITLDNIFSADFNAYKIVASGGSAGAAALVFQLQLLDNTGTPITSGYYETFIYSAYAGATVLSANGNNIAYFQRFGGSLATSGTYGSCELINPFAATPTIFHTAPRVDAAGGNAGMAHGYQSSAVSCRGIKLTCSASNVTGTILTAYGYRL